VRSTTTPLSSAPDAPVVSAASPCITAFRIIHPFPTLLNVAATAGLAAVAVGGMPDGARLARMLLMMLFVQSTIGIVNDLFDRDLDARTKPWKPLSSGVISPGMGVALAGACAAASVVLAATLGAGGFALGLLGLACGLSYDAGLKRTSLSAAPLMIAIPTLPLWVWVSLDRWDAVLWWIVPLGALIGLSLHLANTLPDVESDAAHGVRGFAHRIGQHAAKLLAWASFGAALALAVAIMPVVDYDLRILTPTLAAGVVTLAASVALGIDGQSTRLQLAFGVMGVGAATAAVGWLAAAT
jgi:4-hydroxybenzoate polyprenyltransferase